MFIVVVVAAAAATAAATVSVVVVEKYTKHVNVCEQLPVNSGRWLIYMNIMTLLCDTHKFVKPAWH